MASNLGVREGHVRTAIGVPGMFAASLWVAKTHATAPLALAGLVLAIGVFLSGTLQYCPVYGLFGQHRNW